VASRAACEQAVAEPRQLYPTRVPISKTFLAPTGRPKISRDVKKACGKPGCLTNHRNQGHFRYCARALFERSTMSELSP
jgi:hypothetical protein